MAADIIGGFYGTALVATAGANGFTTATNWFEPPYRGTTGGRSMYADVSFQNAVIREASSFSDLASTPFFIKLDGDDGSRLQVCIHLENADLADALVTAINDVLARFRPPAAEPAATDEDDIPVPF
jgi:hypothetical protein